MWQPLSSGDLGTPPSNKEYGEYCNFLLSGLTFEKVLFFKVLKLIKPSMIRVD